MRDFPLGFEKIKNFKEVFEKGKKFKTLTSQVILLLEESHNKKGTLSLGVLTLKKILGKKATVRNKAKRRFKHALLNSLPKTLLESGFHIKIIALLNKNTVSYPWTQILSDIEKELKFMNEEIVLKRGSSLETTGSFFN